MKKSNKLKSYKASKGTYSASPLSVTAKPDDTTELLNMAYQTLKRCSEALCLLRMVDKSTLAKNTEADVDNCIQKLEEKGIS